ncbi:hypothetical protein Landi51_12550 [Colletotrichum acutatum]
MYRHLKTPPKWEKAFSLQFCHANLLSYTRFLLRFEEGFKKHKGVYTTRTELQQGNVEKITGDYQLIQQFSEIGDRMVIVIESLVEILQNAMQSPTESSTPTPRSNITIPTTSENPEIAAIDFELRLHIKQMSGSLSRLTATMEHDLRLLELRREVKQMDDVQQPSILATIFLPLSISAGILSMQTRFKDLGSLLYDIFGVMILLGALALCSILVLNFVKFGTRHLAQIDMIVYWNMNSVEDMAKQKHQLAMYVLFRKFVPILWWLGLGLLSILVVVSFLVGMFEDIDLGARMLGYGIAILSLPVVIAVVLAFLVSAVAGVLKRREEAEKMGPMQNIMRFERLWHGKRGDA